MHKPVCVGPESTQAMQRYAKEAVNSKLAENLSLITKGAWYNFYVKTDKNLSFPVFIDHNINTALAENVPFPIKTYL